MKIECSVKKNVLHVIFPQSYGDTWNKKHSQFLKDQLHPEDIYDNPELCKDVLQVSKRYEGENRFVGFNFPASYIRKSEISLYPYKNKVRYVIAYMKGDTHTIEHEKRHALFYLDKHYRTSVKRSWKKLERSNPKRHKSILKKLKKDGYKKEVFIDEFQAYYPNLIEITPRLEPNS